MSALPPKADICSALVHVRFVPIADIISISDPEIIRRLADPVANGFDNDISAEPKHNCDDDG
jgi:hypothetical protein